MRQELILPQGHVVGNRKEDLPFPVLSFSKGVGCGIVEDTISELASGKKTAITTGAFTLLENMAFVQPGGDTQMYLQSSSVNDTSAGTGAQRVTIEYFSLSWGTKKEVNVITDGTNQVLISVSDIYRIHKVRVSRGHFADGDITITNQAVSIEYGRISQYTTFMERCIFYIGKNQKAIITQAIIGSTTAGGVNVRLIASREEFDGEIVTRGGEIVEVVDNVIQIDFDPWLTITNPNNKRIAVGLAVNSNSPAQKCTATIKGIVRDI